MTILKLPNEIVLRILRYLDNNEIHKLIEEYRLLPSAQPILRLLFERLFGGTLIIINEQPRLQFAHDYELTIDSFEDKLLNLDSFENLLFQKIRPNVIEFRFTRQHNEYQRFLHDLSRLHSLIDSGNESTRRYFKRILNIHIHIDAHLVFMENPDSLKSIIVKLILELSSCSLVHKIRNLTIKSSEIGSLYVAQWSQLFKQFKSLEVLDLLGNLLKSNYEQYLDVWGMLKKFPDTLTTLNLRNNMISYVSKDFISNLPQSLRILDMDQNDVEIVEPCEVGKLIPNLRKWSMNHTKLSVIHPSMFKTCLPGFILEMKGTYLPTSDVHKFFKIAKEGSFVVVV